MGNAKLAFSVRPRLTAEKLENAEAVQIDIFDVIGDSYWRPDAIGARSVLKKLREAGKANEIRVRINSGGGSAFDGLAIYALLVSHEARVIIDIDGLAASAASVIAMAGDEIRIAETAMLMIHNPWTVAVGEASELRKEAEDLDKLRDALSNAYMARTGMTREQIVDLLDAETWLTAQEALELGFVTSITPAKAAASMLRSEVDLDAFQRTPEALERQFGIARLVHTLTRVRSEQEPTPKPAPPAQRETAIPPTEAVVTKGNNTMNATIAQALGLPVGATETDCIAAAARMRELEVQVCAITGAETSSQALGAVRSLRESADKAVSLQADLIKVQRERDAQNFAALLQQGQRPPVKLSPASAKHYQERFDAAVESDNGPHGGSHAASVVDDLRGFLRVAPTIIAQRHDEPNGASGGSASTGSSPLAYNGKTYADMTPMERHGLWQENPELWKQMKRDHDSRFPG